jgi:hypothetical protein
VRIISTGITQLSGAALPERQFRALLLCIDIDSKCKPN